MTAFATETKSTKAMSALKSIIAGVIMIAAASMTQAAHAQEYKVMRWSVSAALDPNPADCTAQVNDVYDILASFDLPISRSFSWVVVCDEKAWWHLKSTPRYTRTNTITGMTDFPNHVVYLKGYKKSKSDLKDTTAHEIGHMVCNCNDEDVADQNKWKILSGELVATK